MILFLFGSRLLDTSWLLYDLQFIPATYVVIPCSKSKFQYIIRGKNHHNWDSNNRKINCFYSRGNVRAKYNLIYVLEICIIMSDILYVFCVYNSWFYLGTCSPQSLSQLISIYEKVGKMNWRMVLLILHAQLIDTLITWNRKTVWSSNFNYGKVFQPVSEFIILYLKMYFFFPKLGIPSKS